MAYNGTMRRIQMATNGKQTRKIVTKLDLNWYALFLHLQNYQENAKLTGDKALCLLYDALIEYMENRLFPYNGDIEDTYVVVEQRTEK